MTALSTGFSEAAKYVDERSLEGWKRLKKSEAVGFGSMVFDELIDVWDECSQDNWDGQRAASVPWDAYNYTKRFLEALPLGTPVPSVGAEADGDLTLEWYRNPRQLLSVSISADGELHYAATIGRNRHGGTIVFLDEVPETILKLIRSACAE